jgi:hypothetical protein
MATQSQNIIMSTAISNPDLNWILDGRGDTIYNHEGNKKFRHVVASYRERYTTARSRKEKSDLFNEVYKRLIDDEEMTFWRQTEGKWVQMSKKQGQFKVAHRFRDENPKKRPAQKQKRESHDETTHSGQEQSVESSEQDSTRSDQEPRNNEDQHDKSMRLSRLRLQLRAMFFGSTSI